MVIEKNSLAFAYLIDRRKMKEVVAFDAGGSFRFGWSSVGPFVESPPCFSFRGSDGKIS